jgi:cysteine desulfurase
MLHLFKHLNPACTEEPPAAQPLPEDEEVGINLKGVHMAGRPLYLDMQATTPVDPRVLDTMLPFYLDQVSACPLA